MPKTPRPLPLGRRQRAATPPITITNGACPSTTIASSSSSCCSRARRRDCRGRRSSTSATATATPSPASIRRRSRGSTRAGSRGCSRIEGIVRNRLKIASAVAQCARVPRDAGGVRQLRRATSGRSSTASRGRTAGARWRRFPRRRAQSDALSKDLARRGFRFVGSTIVYAFMQATGLVNDHLVSCPRWREVQHARLSRESRPCVARSGKIARAAPR